MDQKSKTTLYVVLGILALLCCLLSSSLGGYYAFRTPSTTGSGTGSGDIKWTDSPTSWMDAMGADIRSTTGTIDQCKAACIADPNCKSFCRSNDAGFCYLRDGRAGPTRPDPAFSCHIKA